MTDVAELVFKLFYDHEVGLYNNHYITCEIYLTPSGYALNTDWEEGMERQKAPTTRTSV